MTLDFINVGYGDAILVRSGSFTMLVDCGDCTVGDGGPCSRRISAAEFLHQEGITALDLLVLTHLHRDHSGGLGQVLAQAQVREFWTNYLPPAALWGRSVPVPETFSAGSRCLLESMNIYLKALAAMAAQGTEVRLLEETYAARRLTAELAAEIHLEERPIYRRQAAIWADVLAGRPADAALNELDRFINNTSIRLRLTCGAEAVELPGDIYAACWERHQLSPCTILKLPHHGHRDSLTPALLSMLSPRDVVISVSNSRTDDCPAAAVMQMVREKGCALHITDTLPGSGAERRDQPSVHFDL